MSNILIIAPHADDEVLGVGGAIARFAEEGNKVTVAILTGHGKEKHPLWPPELWEQIRVEALGAHEILGVSQTLFRELPAVMVKDQPLYYVNKVVGDLIEEVRRNN